MSANLKDNMNDSQTTIFCTICHEEEKIHAVPHCNHRICFKCSTRLRFLHQQFYCPICRTDCSMVVFLNRCAEYANVNTSTFIVERKAKIFFEDLYVKNEFQSLIDHVCVACSKNGTEKHFQSFKELQSHMRKEHELYYCDVCTDNIKLFTRERKVYSRSDLARHKRKGDPDDTSFKGHPLCQICDKHFLDTDELWRHLRKDHFFCHFCDADGEHIYFESYEHVKDHFREDHYLCEEDDCVNVQFTNAFRTELDLKAHKAQNHLKTTKRSQQKQARTIEVELNYGDPRKKKKDARKTQNEDLTKDGIDESRSNPSGIRQNSRFTQEEIDTAKAIAASLNESTNKAINQQAVNVTSNDEFPTLGGEKPATSQYPAHISRNTLAFHDAEQYPTLSKLPTGAPPVESQESRRKPEGRVDPEKTKPNAFAAKGKPLHSDEDFPLLENATVKPHVHGWHVKKPEPKSVVNLVGNSKPVINSHEDFPSLGGVGSLASLGSWVSSKGSKRASEEAKRETTSVESYKKKNNKKQPAEPGIISQKPGSTTMSTQPNQNLPTKDLSSKAQQNASAKQSSEKQTTQIKEGSSKSSKKKNKVSVVAGSTAVTTDNDKQELNQAGLDKSSGKTVTARDKSNSSKSKKLKAIAADISDDSFSMSKPTSKDTVTYTSDKSDTIIKTPATNGVHITGKGENLIDNEISSLKSKLQEMRLSDEYQSIKEASQSKTDDEFPSLKGNLQKPLIADDFPSLKGVTQKTNLTDVGNFSLKGTMQKTKLIVDDFPSLKEMSQKTKLKDDDFPSLKSASQKPIIKPPPGLKEITPPPGLQANTRPPPGLPMKSNALTLSTVAESIKTTSDQTNSEYMYITPPNFSERNKKLILKLKELIYHNMHKFEEFKRLSGSFRSDLISAEEFYEACCKLLTDRVFFEILPELLALLPIIAKQQELYLICVSSLEKFQDSDDNWRDSKSSRLTVCKSCSQVLQAVDLNLHQQEHLKTDDDYPPLGNDGPVTVKSAWTSS